MTFEDRKKAAKAAINELFSDTTVSPETTRDALEDLLEEIKDLLNTF
jgi:flagellar basal body-associated protein FliL